MAPFFADGGGTGLPFASIFNGSRGKNRVAVLGRLLPVDSIQQACPCAACVTLSEARELGLELCTLCEDESPVICGYEVDGTPKYCSQRPTVPFKFIFGSRRSNHVGEQSDRQTVSVAGLKGYNHATVLLNGWQFDFHHEDHHLNETGIRLADVRFDRTTGSLSWVAEVDYADKNFDDEFVWTYWYVVVAFTDGELIDIEVSGSDDGGKHELSGSTSLGQGLEEAIMLLRGWKFDYTSRDHDVNELAVVIRKESFDTGTGNLNWSATLDYADKNWDDDYNWWLWDVGFASPDIAEITSPLPPAPNRCGGGECSLRGETVTIPQGYDQAVVFLTGWKFDYTDPEHHVNEVGVRIENQEVNVASRVLTWDVVVDFLDRNGDDEYEWQYSYTVVGVRSAQVQRDAYEPPWGAPKPLVLEETIYVDPTLAADRERDQDHDWLKDDLEGKLAEHFKPYYQFDSAESHRRPVEPVTLFQVRPVDCTGVGCAGKTKVKIRWAWLFRKDGGYGPSSWCSDSHDGDNSTGDYELDSADGGLTWTLRRIFKGKKLLFKDIELPLIEWTTESVLKLEVHDYSHPIIYMSAHKHHEHLSNAGNHRDSPHSGWGCNDDVDGNGDYVVPDLHSHFGDSRFNNVGEPGDENHPPAHFVNEFTTSEFPGESAWGKDKFYDVPSNAKKWMDHPCFGPGGVSVCEDMG
jgi:hypothetical protein